MFEQLANYKILDWIGSDALGEVCRARDTHLGRTVAIKMVHAAVTADPDRRERFLRDARAAAALSHPNIALLYEIGQDEGQLFLVFEFVVGESLKTIIGGRPLNPRRAIHIATQVADALAEAHAAAIVHGDLNASNIVITGKGSAKLRDVGFASWMTPTPGEGVRDVFNQAADISSLGAVLYEMLVGSPPSTAEVAVPSSRKSNVPPEIDPIVGKALARNPGFRYESAATLAAELRAVDEVLEQRVQQTGNPARAGSPTRARSSGRGRFGRWMVAAILLAGAAGATWLVSHWSLVIGR